MARLRFGIKTAPQHTNYADMLKIWQAAEAVEVFEHAWLFDHFIPIGGDPDGPCLEGWTLLAAFAARTSRIRVGIMVTGNTYRHPAVLANMGATVDIIANGRLDMGIGAGWNQLEHDSYGIELLPPGKRISQFEEACEVIRLLWTEKYADFNGTYYQLKEARCEPKPVQKPYPPFVIGGSGEKRTLRVVAKYADVWNFSGGTVDEFSHKLEVLTEHCRAVGRDPDSIEKSIQLMTNYDDLGDLVARTRDFVAAGANHIIFNLRWPYPEGIVERLAQEVVPQVRS
ncbi:MAG: LLM class F420-dependent oxidoreductase [Roseiflexaceae bacterium]